MRVKSGDRPDVEDLAEHCPREAISIMKQCWAVHPDDRPTFAGESVVHDCVVSHVVIFLVRC